MAEPEVKLTNQEREDLAVALHGMTCHLATGESCGVADEYDRADAVVIGATVEGMIAARREEYHALHVGVLAQAQREAWAAGHAAGIADATSVPRVGMTYRTTENPHAEIEHDEWCPANGCRCRMCRCMGPPLCPDTRPGQEAPE